VRQSLTVRVEIVVASKAMSKYKISVIVPVYNAEQYIGKCVQSILSQSLDGMEIILVNDGSTDKSAELLNQYSKKYDNITVIHQENAKQGAARNAGMSIAKGEYIAFVDADDYLSGDHFGEMYGFCSQNQLDMYGSSALCLDKENRISEEAVAMRCEEDTIYSGEAYITEFGYVIKPMVPLYLFKRSFLNDNNLRFIKHVFSEDNLFILQCISKAKRMAHHRYAHYIYVYNEKSTTNDYNPKFCFDNIIIGASITQYVFSNKFSPVVCRIFLKYAAYISHASLTKATDLGISASDILTGQNRSMVLSALKYDIKYLPARVFISLHLENLYQFVFLKKLIYFIRKLLN